MAKRRIYVDKTEIVFLVPTKNKVVRHNLSAGEITRIQFDKTVANLFGFIKCETEAITVVSGRLGNPIVYRKSQNRKYFDEYKRELERFAAQNYVTFVDKSKDSE